MDCQVIESSLPLYYARTDTLRVVRGGGAEAAIKESVKNYLLLIFLHIFIIIPQRAE